MQNEDLRDQHVSETPREAAAAAPGNSTGRKSEEREVTVTYPSRLIYYLNEDLESTYHDLDTRARNQAGDGQVRRGLSCSVKYEDPLPPVFRSSTLMR